ncbi:MAG: 5-formyltetrahydrofolate cyclo-ligase [Acidimicrobiales bacterium]|nr:5-formyltetrahydrofolate cyclo-ligase [Acidimicrobiales bacterium]
MAAKVIARLRQEARVARRALPRAARRSGAAALTDRILALPEVDALPPGGIVAGFMAFDGEIDVGPAMRALGASGFEIALPRIDADAVTFHLAAEPGADGGDLVPAAMVPGRFGILEPTPNQPRADRLGLVLVPLVAFDAQCHRIGMGRGYYDRFFADWPTRPPLIGVAFDAQQVDSIPARRWDVSLDAVVTPSHTHRSGRPRN